MCFYNDDYDWIASVQKSTIGTAQKKTQCHECSRWIYPGEWIKHIFQQEYESCVDCDDGDSDCEHDYGETFDYYRCKSCEKILRGIKAVEEREGCPAYAQQPSLGGLWEELQEHSAAPEYAREALAMYPELKCNEIIEMALEVR